MLFNVLWRAATLTGNADIIQVDVYFFDIQFRYAGIAYSRQNTPPVRVRGKQRSLDQGRVGDSVGDIQALVAIAAAVDLNSDKLGCALTITNDGLGQHQQHVLDRCSQLGVARRLCAVDRRNGGLAGRNQHAGVVGAGVAVDGDTVERQICGFTQQRLQYRLGNRRIGSNVTQHGSHVWTNHPGAFGDTGDGHGLTGDLNLPAAAFWLGIGCHDAFGSDRPVIFGQVFKGCRQHRNNFVGGQQLANYAGAERQNLLWRNASQTGQCLTGALGCRHAGLAGSGIGVAGIDQQITRSIAHALTAEGDRCGAKRVQREHAGNRRAFCRLHDDHVLATGPLDARRSNTKTKTGNRVQHRQRAKTDRHDQQLQKRDK